MSPGSSLQGSCTHFLVSYFYLTMTKPGVLGRAGTFWFFGAFALASLVWALWRVPETKGRSLEEIEDQVTGDEAGPAAEAA